MQITIRNNAQLPKKYLRFIKWKLYGIKNKFSQLSSAEVFLNTEGQSPKTFIANIRLGIPGNDITIHSKSEDLNVVFRKTSRVVHRHLIKQKKGNSKTRA